MSKTRWFRVRVVQKKAHVRRKYTFSSFRTSLACQIAAADLVYEFGHVAEIVLVSNAISFSQNLVAGSPWLLRAKLHRFDLHDRCEEQ